MISYNDARKKINDVNTSLKEKVFIGFFSFIVGLISVAGPITIFANLLVFIDYAKLYIVLIGIFAVIGLLLADYLYYKGISKLRLKDFLPLILVDGIIILIAVAIIMVIIAIQGGII